MAKCWLFHGDNYPQSRARLVALIDKPRNQGLPARLAAKRAGKAGTKELIRLDGQKVSLSEVKQALEAKSLFGGERVVAIENLLSSPASKRQKEIIDYLLKESHDFPLVLWEKREIKGAILNKFKAKFEIEIFKIPAIIFKLLDSLKPGDSQRMISLFHQIDQKEPEMTFYMLIQRIRQLILAKDLGKKGLEGLQGWQRARLLNQAENFKLRQLTSFYHRLLEIDYQQKTSQTPFTLLSTLDLLLADL